MLKGGRRFTTAKKVFFLAGSKEKKKPYIKQSLMMTDSDKSSLSVGVVSLEIVCQVVSKLKNMPSLPF